MVKYASFFISFFLAFLYCLGSSYNTGFLMEFGLESSQFNMDVDQIFFHGFYVASNLGFPVALYMFMVVSLGLFLIIMIYLYMFLTDKKDPFYRFFNWLFRKVDGFVGRLVDNHKSKDEKIEIYFEGPIVNVFSMLSMYFASIFVIFVVFILIIIASERSGIESAEKFIEKAAGDESTLVEVKLRGGDSYKGVAIKCSDTQCAYYVEGSAMVFNKKDMEWASIVRK